MEREPFATHNHHPCPSRDGCHSARTPLRPFDLDLTTAVINACKRDHLFPGVFILDGVINRITHQRLMKALAQTEQQYHRR